jgi:YHS domain-containing protein
MTTTDFFERVAALRREGQTFAVATVVARRAPLSPHRAGVRGEDAEAARAAAPATALDPVCGMHVEVATARHTAEVDGRLYYFCCPHCRAAFVGDPQHYGAPAS